MRRYKLVLILQSDVKREKKQKLLEDVKKWIGKIEKESVKEIGERRLAYTIKKSKTGEYVLLEFEAEKVAADLEKRLIVQDEILRHLLVRTK